MITAVFTKPKDSNTIIWNHDILFDNVYEDEWFTDPLVQEMARTIDRAEYFDGNMFKTDIFGYVPATNLSTGFKTLVLALKYDTGDRLLKFSAMGDNCFPFLDKIKNLCNARFYADFIIPIEDGMCEIYSEESGRMIDNRIAFVEECVKYGWCGGH